MRRFTATACRCVKTSLQASPELIAKIRPRPLRFVGCYRHSLYIERKKTTQPISLAGHSCCHVFTLVDTGFGLVIGCSGLLQLATASNCTPYQIPVHTLTISFYPYSSHLTSGDCDDSCPTICLLYSSVLVVIVT
jgi:hypothetical protein